MWNWLGPLSFAALVAACGGSNPETPGPENAQTHTSKVGDTEISWSQGEAPPRAPGTSIDVSTLEIRADSIDRFSACPPSGDLGQGWIPAIGSWTAPAPAQGDPQPEPTPQTPDMQGQLPLTRTEKAIEDTRNRFRDCYHMGLVHDPT